MTREELFRIPVPTKTETYSPVSHKSIVSRIEKQLVANDLDLVKESFVANKYGEQVIGLMDIRSLRSDELGMRIAWRNSYDKSKTIAFAAGANAWICGNGMLFGDIQYIRKHTGNVLNELSDKISISINQLSGTLNEAVEYSILMKDIHVSKHSMAKMMGILFVEYNIITVRQMSVVKQQIVNSDFEDFKYENLWSFYNHVTFALKNTHPSQHMQKHLEFHNFVKSKFAI